MDGVYDEEYIKNVIAGSSRSLSTSLPSRLFYLYQKSVFSVDDGYDSNFYNFIFICICVMCVCMLLV